MFCSGASQSPEATSGCIYNVLMSWSCCLEDHWRMWMQKVIVVRGSAGSKGVACCAHKKVRGAVFGIASLASPCPKVTRFALSKFFAPAGKPIPGGRTACSAWRTWQRSDSAINVRSLVWADFGCRFWMQISDLGECFAFCGLALLYILRLAGFNNVAYGHTRTHMNPLFRMKECRAHSVLALATAHFLLLLGPWCQDLHWTQHWRKTGSFGSLRREIDGARSGVDMSDRLY